MLVSKIKPCMCTDRYRVTVSLIRGCFHLSICDRLIIKVIPLPSGNAQAFRGITRPTVVLIPVVFHPERYLDNDCQLKRALRPFLGEFPDNLSPVHCVAARLYGRGVDHGPNGSIGTLEVVP